MARTKFKKLIAEHGLEKILENPGKWLERKKYTEGRYEYIRQLKSRLKKRYGNTNK